MSGSYGVSRRILLVIGMSVWVLNVVDLFFSVLYVGPPYVNTQECIACMNVNLVFWLRNKKEVTVRKEYD